VTALNDPPVLGVVEREQLQALTGVSLFDPDSDIGGARVSIGAGFSSSQDRLEFENQRGVTGTYDTGTGVLTLTGTAPPADYQAAIQSVRLVKGGGSRSLKIEATDQHNGYVVLEYNFNLGEFGETR
jgi:hypothetical protein